MAASLFGDVMFSFVVGIVPFFAPVRNRILVCRGNGGVAKIILYSVSMISLKFGSKDEDDRKRNLRPHHINDDITLPFVPGLLPLSMQTEVTK